MKKLKYLDKTLIALIYFELLAEKNKEPNKYDASLYKDREKARVLFTHFHEKDGLDEAVLKKAFEVYIKKATLELFPIVVTTNLSLPTPPFGEVGD